MIVPQLQFVTGVKKKKKKEINDSCITKDIDTLLTLFFLIDENRFTPLPRPNEGVWNSPYMVQYNFVMCYIFVYINTYLSLFLNLYLNSLNNFLL